MNGTAYEHSGKLGLGLIVPVVGFAAALLLGLAYAYIDVYSPIVGWISLLFMGGFTFALGLTVSTAGNLLKVRSTAFMAMVGLFVGAIGLYAAWAAFESAVIGRAVEKSEEAPGFMTLLLRPDAVWAVACGINEHGWYSIKSATPSGAVLWAFWGIEALVVVGGTAFLSPMGINEAVFCEACDQWCADGQRPRLRPPGDANELQTAIEGGARAIEALEKLPAAPDEEAHLLVDLKQCQSCKQTATAQLKLVVHSVDKEGKVSTEAKALTPQYLVDPQEYARLLALAERPVQPPPEAEAAAEDEQPSA